MKSTTINIDAIRRVVRVTGELRTEAFDRTDCLGDNGIRPEFKRRPDLYLFAMIAASLLEVADAIRNR